MADWFQEAMRERLLSKKKYWFWEKNPPDDWQERYLRIADYDFMIFTMLDDGTLHGYIDFKRNTRKEFMLLKMVQSGINTKNVSVKRMERKGTDADKRLKFMIGKENVWTAGFVPGWGKEQKPRPFEEEEWEVNKRA